MWLGIMQSLYGVVRCKAKAVEKNVRSAKLVLLLRNFLLGFPAQFYGFAGRTLQVAPDARKLCPMF